MPISGQADYLKPSRRLHNESGELDVFEAARYFAGYNDNFGLGGGASYLMTREDRQGHLRTGRTSLDLPSLKYHHLQYNHQKEQHPSEQLHHHHQKHHRHRHQEQQIKDKKYKQPSSPSGRLAHFLNTLFNQAMTSKKKKSSKSSSQTIKDEDESSSARRRRRSSISHFRSTSSTAVDTKSLHSSCSSFGFRSPPPYNNLNTPTTSVRSFSDHWNVLATSSEYNDNGKRGNNRNSRKDDQQSIRSKFLNWTEEKMKFQNRLVEKITKKNSNHRDQENKKQTKKFIKEEVDGGVESDSSSDLFELKIDYGFGFCSGGLPVYETTHLDSIKRPSATALTNGSIQG